MSSNRSYDRSVKVWKDYRWWSARLDVVELGQRVVLAYNTSKKN